MAILERALLWLATGLGISYIAPAGRGRKWTGAGLLGTLEGLLLWPLLPSAPGPYAAAVAAAVAAACFICGSAERTLQTHDDTRIVLDEIVGFWVAAAWLPGTWAAVGLAFVLFRFFDAVKLPPYKWLERLPGGAGVVMDDVGAGIAANLSVRLILASGLLGRMT
ncbi:MAG: phosphatidylglycerophosphatase A [Elusimicrobia bacterium]|nr:phosphatidylglycerophosphatase A [Elusimicrobiota bacterium]